VLDVDANSNYGASLANFMLQFGGEVNRRTTVLILGDGRGKWPRSSPRCARRSGPPRSRGDLVDARIAIFLGSRGSDMPLYESLCSRVEVVPDLQSLDRMARTLTDAGGR
jgi:hypothetical protein